jgi:hypothetical protein
MFSFSFSSTLAKPVLTSQFQPDTCIGTHQRSMNDTTARSESRGPWLTTRVARGTTPLLDAWFAPLTHDARCTPRAQDPRWQCICIQARTTCCSHTEGLEVMAMAPMP